MASEQELKNSDLHKEFQNLLDKDFKDRKLKENEIIKATVTEITKNFVVVDCKAKMEGMIPVEEFKVNDELAKLKVGSAIEVYLERIERNPAVYEKEGQSWFKNRCIFRKNREFPWRNYNLQR